MKPHAFQRDAINRIVRELRAADRTKAIMPCGTGKSLVGLRVRRRLKPTRSLVVAPSLALIKQLLDFYASQRALPRVLVVCSDDSTAKAAREKYDIPTVTTDPQVVAKELRKRGDLVVFSTYQSTPRIAEAYQIGRVPKFAFGLFDEAHRMAGGNSFGTALDEAEIPITKRLFLTATPRVATRSARQQAADTGIAFASMDNESQFGREAFYMSFNEAIAGGHLTDYQVVVFAVKESEVHALVSENEDARELAKRVAMVRAMGEHDLRKVIAYHRTVRQMEWFAQTGLQKTFEESKAAGVVDGRLWSGSLSGSDSASARREILQEFASLNGDYRAVLNNCRVLQEGVDCPAVDAVCLIDPRSQPVDIVQIIGRAIRKSPSKTISTIIMPVFIPGELENDVEQFVASSEFAPVLDVIAAIRSHDDRVQGWVSSPRRYSESAGSDHSKIRFSFAVPLAMQGRLFDAISSRIVRRFREPMPLTQDLIWEWMQAFHVANHSWPAAKTEALCPDGSTWLSIESALWYGSRGLSGNSSLFKLRNSRLGATIHYTEPVVRRWMQDYYSRYGDWPNTSTAEPCPNGLKWVSLNTALRRGNRILLGGSSLDELKSQMTGKRRLDLTEDLVVQWMRAHHSKSGFWPTQRTAEPCPDGTNWSGIEKALEAGLRGLPGGASLTKLRNQVTGQDLRALSETQIWRWMREHYETHRSWPSKANAAVAPCGASWVAINSRLRVGSRGLPGGSSLAKLRAKMLARAGKE